MISPNLLAVLACPACQGEVILDASADGFLRCEVCQRRYSIVEGIPLMVVEDVLADGDYKTMAMTVREYYDTTADSYDDWHVSNQIDRLVDEVNWEEFRSFVGARKTNRCLDLACGTGRNLDRLRASSQSVVGVDISMQLLLMARKKKGVQADFVCGEVTHLPLCTRSFDLVVIDGSLHHFFAAKEAIEEAARVLQPGGILALLGEPNARWKDWRNPFFTLTVWSQTPRIFRNRVWPRLRSVVGGGGSILTEGPEEDIDPRQLGEICRSAGIEVVRLGTYDYLPRSGHWWHLVAYRWLRRIERQALSKWFPFAGQAVVCYGVKR
ncbi:MAG: methyltransferase domain-containing protein [Chloroflexota bacterium]